MTEPGGNSTMTATFRCSLDVGGERITVYRQVDRMLLTGRPEIRDWVQRDARSALAREIVDKLAPEVVEVSPDGPTPERRLDRAEALRLAKAQVKALAGLASRLEEAGENYALQDAWQARDTAQALVDKLEGDDGRLPTDPRFWSARLH
ncbi:hypothetical protein ACIBAC_11910 [Streptomyces sp. NPDC051362]|uniref:hypothetical protein n=1 Tax=Streptomyces sp. NPDC051362 TaxID=3365651 RepID=UPI0037A624BF